MEYPDRLLHEAIQLFVIKAFCTYGICTFAYSAATLLNNMAAADMDSSCFAFCILPGINSYMHKVVSK